MRAQVHFLADNGYLDDLKALLRDDPKQLEAQDDEGCTPIWYAVFSGRTEMVKYLISLGANVNAQGGEARWTPLHLAAVNGRKDLMELLIANGADVNVKDAFGKTPLETKKVGGCYIATACYGDYDHPDVVSLRRFRDEVLLASVAGRAVVAFYYLLSPFLARHIGASARLSGSIRRTLLEPLVRRVR